ncbi:SRPBCC family protein [uncultured Jatrophihabitans sp.]|uniref:SRPBCC family protein n=1 Tax=uncultured Jatrophihabitans sp. TaxID=1610747 RepID=UPI0035C99386
MPQIRHSGTCDAPLEFTFAYLNDYRNATTWMFGLTSFEPLSEQVDGVGATFEGTFEVKPVKLSSIVRFTEWEKESVITFESISGFANRSRWRFIAAGPFRTHVDVLFGYDLPGGLAGRALAKVLEPIVTASIRRSDATLRREVATRWQKADESGIF